MKGARAVICIPFFLGMAHAQDLRDPTQPPSPAYGATAGLPGGDASDGEVLQSIVVSKGRRLATIGGKVYKVGDRVGGARLVSISSGEVSLSEAGKIRVLRLVPDSVGKTANVGGSQPRPRAKTPDRSGEKG